MRHVLLTLVGTAIAMPVALAQPSATRLAAPASVQRTAAAALGDLAPYKTITADTLSLVKKGDIAAAQKRGTDLETAWDKAEDTMKLKDPVRWRVVDKAIDKVLGQLRAPAPDAAGCATALTDLLVAIDRGGAA